MRCNLISTISNKSHEEHYQPAIDTDHLSIAYIIEQIDESGSNEEIYLIQLSTLIEGLKLIAVGYKQLIPYMEITNWTRKHWNQESL